LFENDADLFVFMKRDFSVVDSIKGGYASLYLGCGDGLDID